MTSATMAMNYFARLKGVFQQTDPGEVNTWLTTADSETGRPRGYNWNGEDAYTYLNWAAIDDASEGIFDTNGPVIEGGALESLASSTDLAGIRDNIQNGQLGVLNVSNGGYGHWVLVTGVKTVNGVETLDLNDPWQDRGAVTLLSLYNNRHLQAIHWYQASDQVVRPNYVRLTANCPVALLVTDQHGRRTGYDPRTGQSYNEIPSSAYATEYYPDDNVQTDDGAKLLQIESYERSQYKVDVIGTGTGAYTLAYAVDLSSGESDRTTYTGTITQGEVDTLTLTYDPNEGIVTSLYLPQLLR